MKRNLLLIAFIHFILALHASPRKVNEKHLSAFNAPGPDAFVTTWATTSDGENILVPVYAGSTELMYNYSVDWGDGSVSDNQTTDATHTYATAGIHTVSITGTFPAIHFHSPDSDDDNDAKLLTVQQWGTQVWAGMDAAFMGCKNLTTVPNENGPVFAPNSTLYCMFYGCSSLNADLDKWNLASVRETAEMFHGASHFNGNISNWNVSGVTDMTNMFQNAKSFNQDIGNWDVSRVTNMNGLFQFAESFNGDISKWNVTSVTNMGSLFADAAVFNQDIGNWNVSSVTNMSSMFSSATAFNQDIGNWNVFSVTDMSSMFFGDSSFNGDINRWNVSHVTDMGSMFGYALSFNQDLSNWVVSSVTNMSAMFANATAFNGDISLWDVSSVKNMNGMFGYALSFNQDISHWNVTNVSDMGLMFVYASVFNQDIGNWDVENAANMKSMFRSATAFDQNLGAWNLQAVTDLTSMLSGSGLSLTNYESTLAGWGTKNVQDYVILGAKGLKYCGVSARQDLIDNHGWTINGDRETCLVPAHPDGAGIVYVDSANAAPGGDGSSWSNALTHLSNATASAVTNTDIKEIHIAKGTYYPTGNQNSIYRDSSFVISRSGLQLLGGYPTGGGARDYQLNPTLLSGDLALPADTTDNSYHVLVLINAPAGNDSLIVDGITITKGNANGINDGAGDGDGDDGIIGYLIGPYMAGGVVMSGVSDNTVMRNCTIKDNYGLLGAGIMVVGGVDFVGQQFSPSTPHISTCLFEHNVTGNATGEYSGIGVYGGAMVNLMASPTIVDCSFIGNKGLFGAAISNTYSSSPVIIGTRFEKNKASGASVILNVEGSNTMLANCILTDNINTGFAPIPGGDDTGAADFNEILGNSVIANIESSSTRIINSTVSGNYSTASPAVSGGNIFNMQGSNLFITNSIIWGNQSTKIVDSLGSITQVAYSLVQGLAADPQNHNLDGTADDSIFVDAANGDYQLIGSSPAINVGLNDSIINTLAPYNGGDLTGGTDIAGNPRILEAVVDLGAFEFNRSALPVKMGQLQGHINGGHAILEWPTYTEVNNKGFQVQASADGVKFVNIDFVPSLGQHGNSSSSLQYNFDAGVITGVKYYRLQQIDYDGRSTSSNVVRLQETNPTFHLTAFPNPARNNIQVSIEGTMAAHPRIIVVDFTGRVLISREITGNMSKVDLSGIASGIYLIKYVDDKQSAVIRMVKQ